MTAREQAFELYLHDIRDLPLLTTDKERQVLALRFGLRGQPLHSRRETARLLGISSEQAQRLEAQALRKLRDPELLRQLQAAMDQ